MDLRVALGLISLVACGGGSAEQAQPCNCGAEPPESERRRVFVTSTPYDGNLKAVANAADGLESGDKLCDAAASKGGLGGTWRAWLSSSTVNAVDRLPENGGPWYLVDRKTKIFLTRTAILAAPANSIDRDETNTRLDLDGGASTLRVWTGSKLSGVVSAQKTCGDWTDASKMGQTGLVGTTLSWSESAPPSSADESCLQKYRLYCFEI